MSYFPPRQPDFNYLSHLEIIGWDNINPLTMSDLKYYIAHINEKGKPDDWFFDSFLVVNSWTLNGNDLYCDVNIGTTRCGGGDFFAVPVSNPATFADWTLYLESLFSKDGALSRIDRTIKELKGIIRTPLPFKRNIVIGIPYPHHNQFRFGKIKKSAPHLNFSVIGQNLMKATEQRFEACRWFVDETIARFSKGKFHNINFLGFYWLYESMHYSWDVDDHWVVKELYKHIRSRNGRFFWIPFFSSFNETIMSNSPGFYFDCAFLQPNLMFYPWLRDVKHAAEAAAARHGGIEIEYYLDIAPAFGIGKEKYRRLRNYLNGGIEYGYMKQSACAYFIGLNDLHKIATHRNPREREVYHDLFHFVKGDYERK